MCPIQDLTSLVYCIADLISFTIPTAVAVCLLFFLWGVYQFFTHPDDPQKRKESVRRMTFGGISLFVVVSLGGIVWLLVNSFFGDVGI